MKVLLNAESFGFGPSAAVAGIFNHLKDFDFISQIDYVGNGHSLDLQRKLEYGNIFEIDDDCDLEQIVSEYDIFLTALDFKKAGIAKSMGVKTIIYDTLLWYWRKIPAVLNDCDYYITQNFYGVEERVRQLGLQSYSVIPPTVQAKVDDSVADTVLINFGGLENPLWDLSISVQYIKNVLDAILPLLSGERVEISCSKAHLPHLSQYPVKNYSYLEMQNILSRTKFLIATPGLGNIYEAANYEIPSLFLPPANDSQGQQLVILNQQGLISNKIDWVDLNKSIDYKQSQQDVLNQIKTYIVDIDLLLLQKSVGMRLWNDENMKLSDLIDTFGSNGNECLRAVLFNVLSKMK